MRSGEIGKPVSPFSFVARPIGGTIIKSGFSLLASAALASLLGTLGIAHAQASVAGLAGKICTGAFQVDQPSAEGREDEGAARISFVAAGAAIYVSFERAFGKAQHDNPMAVRDFPDKARLVDLKLVGDQVSFGIAGGADWALKVFRDGDKIVLRGTFDPTRTNPSGKKGVASFHC